jgi:pyruvate-ferredoxin/flavodoxin oxidoreductase
MQGTIAHPNHLIEGFIEGLKTRRPALFNLYTSCQPEHGIGDDMSANQAKLAVESRAYPLFRYNPDLGTRPEECFDLEGNPAVEQDWPTYELKYTENGRHQSMELPMTFADFAATEIRFRKHFRVAPPETWNEKMIPLADFLELPEDEREGRFPFVWSVNREQQLMRLLVALPIVQSCEDRRDFWTMLRAIARVGEKTLDRKEIEADVRREMTNRVAAGIMQLVTGEGSIATATVAESDSTGGAVTSAGESMASWIDTPQCTSCDECVRLNPNIFQYNEKKKAIIRDPLGGPYKDLVKAAERCTAQIIHPGLPKDRSEKDIDKWIARAEKYNQ